MSRAIALGYRLGFILACVALLVFLLAEAMLPEETKVGWVIKWLAVGATVLLAPTGLIDAMFRRRPETR